MEDQEIRMRCLELAVGVARGQMEPQNTELVATIQKKFYALVVGTEEATPNRAPRRQREDKTL